MSTPSIHPRRNTTASLLKTLAYATLATLTPLQATITVSSSVVSNNGMSPTTNGEKNRNFNFSSGAVTSFNGWQYVAYWNNDGPSVGYHVSVARRQLPSGTWQVIDLTDYDRNQDTDTTHSAAAKFGDGHEKVALGVSPDGHIHLAFDHHVDHLHYRRTINPIAANPGSATWAASQFGPTQRNLGAGNVSQVTYPSFYADYGANNFAMYLRSPGGSGSGDSCFFTYRNGTWLQQTVSAARFIDNTTNRSADRNVNAYPFGIHVDGNTVHITWCWRDTPDAATNFDLCHAFSTDFGTTWRDKTNTIVGTRGAADNTAALLSADDTGIAGVSLARGKIMNNGSMAIDANKNIHVLCVGPTGERVHYMRRSARDSNNNPQNHGGTWQAPISVPNNGHFVAGPNNRLFLVTKSGIYETNSNNPSWSNTPEANAPADSIDGIMNLAIDTSRLRTEGIITVIGQNNGTNVTALDYKIGEAPQPSAKPAASSSTPGQ